MRRVVDRNNADSREEIQSRVLASLASLQARRPLDVNAIDGEFYWGFCCPDFADFVVVQRARLRDASPEERELLFLSGALDAEFTSRFGIPPGAALAHVVHGHPLCRREPTVTVSTGTDLRRVERVALTVTTPTWTGRDIAPRLRGASNAAARELRRLLGPPPVQDGDDIRDSVRLDFELIANEGIVVTAWLPLPSDEVLASVYDEIVRERHRWHETLPGSEIDQSCEVAMRTWAVGLLHGALARFRWADAMRIVQEASGLDDTQQAGFHGDRDRLLARVPEAEPFLFNRPRRRRPN
jgi:hypothetical protein